MLNPGLSNKLWDILKERARGNRLYLFSVKEQVIAVTVETFTVKRKLSGGRVEVKRNYYRIVRDKSKDVLYDELEVVSRSFVDQMAKSKTLVPDIRISPNRSNSVLVAVLEQQVEIDKLIAEARV